MTLVDGTTGQPEEDDFDIDAVVQAVRAAGAALEARLTAIEARLDALEAFGIGADFAAGLRGRIGG